MASDLPQGWGRPLGSTYAHYYLEGQTIALCGKWWFAGERHDRGHGAKQNCEGCRAARLVLSNATADD